MLKSGVSELFSPDFIYFCSIKHIVIMRKQKSHVLTNEELFNRYANEVTCMNLISHNHNAFYTMSKSYYKRLCYFNLIDECNFNIKVSKFSFTPLKPEPMFNF